MTHIWCLRPHVEAAWTPNKLSSSTTQEKSDCERQGIPSKSWATPQCVHCLKKELRSKQNQIFYLFRVIHFPSLELALSLSVRWYRAEASACRMTQLQPYKRIICLSLLFCHLLTTAWTIRAEEWEWAFDTNGASTHFKRLWAGF